MTLQKWETNSWIQKHSTSCDEINNLFQLVRRDIASAYENSNPDWIFNIVYNAALKLCTILLHSSGYKATRSTSLSLHNSIANSNMGHFFSRYC